MSDQPRRAIDCTRLAVIDKLPAGEDADRPTAIAQLLAACFGAQLREKLVQRQAIKGKGSQS